MFYVDGRREDYQLYNAYHGWTRGPVVRDAELYVLVSESQAFPHR